MLIMVRNYIIVCCSHVHCRIHECDVGQATIFNCSLVGDFPSIFSSNPIGLSAQVKDGSSGINHCCLISSIYSIFCTKDGKQVDQLFNGMGGS